MTKLRDPHELLDLFRKGFRDAREGKYPRDGVHGREVAYRMGREWSLSRRGFHDQSGLTEEDATARFADLAGCNGEAVLP